MTLLTPNTRLRAAAANRVYPAKSKGVFSKSIASITTVARNVSYRQISPASASSIVRVPSIGQNFMIVLYLAFVIALLLASDNYPGAQHLEAYGIRAGWLATAHLPLLVVLVGKVNFVGFFTGLSYERLNVYHRWVARGFLLLATLHFALQGRNWSLYGLFRMEWTSDPACVSGIASFVLILWMNISTLAPIRNFSYKFFVIQHVLTFMGMIIGVAYHLNDAAQDGLVYIYVTVGFFAFDRLLRFLIRLWNGSPPAKASLEALDGEAVKIRVFTNRIKSWSPGAHVRLTFPSFGLWHTHPATVLSTPSSHDGDLVFILRARGGFTKKLLRSAEAVASVPTTHTALIDGPFPSRHNDFAAYHTVALIAGGTGVTSTLAILNDLAARAGKRKIAVQTVEFTWVVRRAEWVRWIATELQTSVAALHAAGIDVKVHVFVTDGGSAASAAAAAQAAVVEKPGMEVTVDKADSSSTGSRLDIVAAADYRAGRPDAAQLLTSPVAASVGEAAVCVCGPAGSHGGCSRGPW